MSVVVPQPFFVDQPLLPRIGVPEPTFANFAYNNECWPQYAKAIRVAGGEAIRLPLQHASQELSALAATCAAFVLPGSVADVAPSLYGQLREFTTAPADAARENCDRLLLEHAEMTGKPVLGICFGAQFLNVWRGGALVQDVLPIPVNHAAGAGVAAAHSILVQRQSLLGSLLTQTEAPQQERFRRLRVNSSHHQAIATPGDGLLVVARSAEDGVVEAVEGTAGLATILGVQWHPERSVEISAASRALFLWLLSAATDAASNTDRPHE